MKFRLFILTLALIGTAMGYSQKDTLRLYYSGLQTKLADSNDVKMTKWAKSLKGTTAVVWIYGYYEAGEYKKYAQERIDEVNLVVLRKARDITFIKSCQAVKGKKSQRSYVDVVYEKEFVPSTATSSGNSGGTQTGGSAGSENKGAAASEPKPSFTIDENGYLTDSVYVNGKLKVTRRKVKKK